jgi:hypothetical protein
LHTLRKEFGSQINARYGLLAASEQLRHGGIAVTARHYVENRSRAVLSYRVHYSIRGGGRDITVQAPSAGFAHSPRMSPGRFLSNTMPGVCRLGRSYFVAAFKDTVH